MYIKIYLHATKRELCSSQKKLSMRDTDKIWQEPLTGNGD